MSIVVVVIVNVEDGLLVETRKLAEASKGTGAALVREVGGGTGATMRDGGARRRRGGGGLGGTSVGHGVVRGRGDGGGEVILEAHGEAPPRGRENGREKDEEGMDERRTGPAQRMPCFQSTPNPLFISFPSPPYMATTSPILPSQTFSSVDTTNCPNGSKFSRLARQILRRRPRRRRPRRAVGRGRWRLDRCGRWSSGHTPLRPGPISYRCLR